MRKMTFKTSILAAFSSVGLLITFPVFAADFTAICEDSEGDLSFAALPLTANPGIVRNPNIGTLENHSITNVDPGETLVCSATANPGFTFERWTITPTIQGVVLTDPNLLIGINTGNNAENYTVQAIFTADPGSDVVVVPVPPDPGGANYFIRIENLSSTNAINFVDHPAGNSLFGREGDVFRITAAPTNGTGFALVGFSGATFSPTNATISPFFGTYVFTFSGTQETFQVNFADPGQDTDGDTIDDANEILFGYDPNNAADGASDNDMDGLTAAQEIEGYIPQREGRAALGPFTSHPEIPDTDGDGIRDGWEAYYGMNPRNAFGRDGAFANNETNTTIVAGVTLPELPTGDRNWNADTGLPTSLFHNRDEYDAFVALNGSEDLDPSVFPSIVDQLSTDPFLADTDGDTLPDGWETTFGLIAAGPNGGLDPNGATGNPDGDQNYVVAANDDDAGRIPANGDDFQNTEEYGRYRDTFLANQADPAVAIIGATNPNDSDTDNDGMPDGWENDMSYGSGFPSPSPVSAAGDDGPNGNPDGDLFYDPFAGACSGDNFRNSAEFVVYNVSDRQGFTTHPNFLDIDADRLPDHWEILFDYDPWFTDSNENGVTDDLENPDGDFMADTNAISGDGSEHGNVYALFGYDPRVGWTNVYDEVYTHLPLPRGGAIPVPNVRPFTNYDEFLGIALDANAYTCRRLGTSNPRSIDTDGDGMWDGWEFYVGLNPGNAGDAGQDIDMDGLSNIAEFGNWYANNLSIPAWFNKIWPTDPNNPDTDGDAVSDSGEVAFIGATQGAWNGHCYPGGGLNPTSCDTDGDHLPDAWEVSYANTNDWTNPGGLEGTVQDADLTQGANDYDQDGLENYQEYFVAATYHWQATDLLAEWVPGGGLLDYDPADFFDGLPFEWDWHRLADFEELEALAFVPFTYILPNPFGYSSTDPLLLDTDEDQMDDYYEVFHGLNPLYGGIDWYLFTFTGGVPVPASPSTFDVRVGPYVSGHPFLDIDQDGLNNAEESFEFDSGIFPGRDVYLHTDPSPHWVTDMSYQLSWPNLYYQWNTFPFYFFQGGIGFPFDFPTYVFDFEANEGYDTDNDVYGDKEEAVATVTPGATDPLDSEEPITFRYMYFDGDAALRTKGAYSVATNALENFTVEMWVRPENPAAGRTQILIERPVFLPAGNTLCSNAVLQLNFRLGINPDGRPFTEYSNSACDPFFVNAVSDPAFVLSANEWVHLAATYSATKDLLSLYVNGDLAQSVPSSLRPANGFIKPFVVGVSPLTLGAREIAAGATVSGTAVIAGPGAGTTFGDPALSNFYEGWMDEVRIWTNDVGQVRLQETMFMEFDRANALIHAESADGLLFHYNFNDVPDPDNDPVSPAGFDALPGRPNDGSYPFVRWWGLAPDRSTVYNDYNYVTWVENVVSHLPINPPADSFVLGVEPNTSNPYNYEFSSALTSAAESHPEFPNVSLQEPGTINNNNDLLPLRNVVADEDIVGWNLFDPINTDTDGDGLPDDWEEAFGLDSLDPNGENGADGDPDNDGLTNETEYKAGTNPRSTDSDFDGVADRFEDSDGDGLTNIQEQNEFFSEPNDPDTDDDGFSDGDEVNPLVLVGNRTLTSPTDSRSPLIQRSAVVDGNPIVIPHTDVFMGPDRFNMTNWTVSVWIQPDTAGQTGSVIRRTTNTDHLTFDLRLDGGVPAIRFTTESGEEVRVSGLGSIPVGEWTHLAGTYDTDNNQLLLYVNGLSPVGQSTVKNPALGDAQGVTVLADGISGNVDEVRLFNNARDPLAVALGMFTFGGGQAPPSPFVVSAPSRTFIPTPGIEQAVSSLPQGFSQNIMLQLHNPLTAQTQSALNAAGIDIVNFVNTRTYVVNATASQLDAAGVKPHIRWAGLVAPGDKLSDRIASGLYSAPQKLVAFYPGVSEAEARAAVAAAGGTILQDKYMDSGYLVISGDTTVVNGLTEKNAVSYILPSPPLVSSGQANYLCPGLPINGVLAAPFVAVGVGWDGPGLGRADLTYTFPDPVLSFPPIATARQKELFRLNLDRWEAVAALTFTETNVGGLSNSIDVVYSPVDGPLGVLGFAYFPNDINPEPIAGDINFDSFEDWTDDTLFSGVTLHELGHSLGMGHSDDFSAVMFPAYLAHVELSADDVAGIRTLYGEAEPVFEDELVAHYSFDDGQNETLLNPISNQIEMRGAEDFRNRGNWAFALQPFVVDAGNSIKIPDPIDTDIDGLPDWWELMFFQSLSRTGLENNDSDSLNNLYEYLSDTDPRTFDSDADGIIDDLEDRDLDGLENASEQTHGSHPGLIDTDDDGLLDNTEVVNGYEPVNSRSPIVRRVLSLPGDSVSYVEYPMQPRFALQTWTLEARVYPTSFANNGVIFEREVSPGVYNYFLRVTTSGNLVAGFSVPSQGTEVTVATTETLPLNRWSHVSASYDPTIDHLSISIDGIEVANLITGSLAPTTGAGPLRAVAGTDFSGFLDNLAIYSERPAERTDQELVSDPIGAPNLVSLLLFDDSFNAGGTSGDANIDWGQVEDFAQNSTRDWERCWQSAATLNGGNLVNGGIPGGNGTIVPDPTVTLTVTPPDCPISDGLSILPLSWNNYGVLEDGSITTVDSNKFWRCSTDEVFRANFSLKSGGVLPNGTQFGLSQLWDSESAVLETQIIGPGQICFSYKTETEDLVGFEPDQADYFGFFVNGVQQLENDLDNNYGIEGSNDWTTVCINITSGVKTLQWRYDKDRELKLYRDSVWLDEITFDSTSPDSDGDGIPDSYEANSVIGFGTDPGLADTDGDGMNDGTEILLGTNPLVAETQTAIHTMGFKPVATILRTFIEWSGQAGVTYQVQKSYDGMNTWVNAPTGAAGDEQSQVTAAADGTIRYCDIASPEAGMPVYRVLVIR